MHIAPLPLGQILYNLQYMAIVKYTSVIIEKAILCEISQSTIYVIWISSYIPADDRLVHRGCGVFIAGWDTCKLCIHAFFYSSQWLTHASFRVRLMPLATHPNWRPSPWLQTARYTVGSPRNWTWGNRELKTKNIQQKVIWCIALVVVVVVIVIAVVASSSK